MPMVYDRRSWLHLSVTAPGEGKRKSVSIVRELFLHPFLLTSSLPRIKKGRCSPSESDMYVCDLCNRNFSTQGSLKRHRESVHHQSDGFSCQVCGQCFYRKDVLQRHLKTHRAACPTDKTFVDFPPPPPPSPVPLPESHGGRPVCDLCAKSFASQKMLKRHRQTVHRQLGGFSCLRTKGNFFVVNCARNRELK